MSLPTCPTGCTAVLPSIDFDFCHPETHSGQVTDIFLTNVDQPFADITDISEWTTRLSENGTDADDIRRLFVVGDKPEPEVNEIQLSKNRTVYGEKRHSINIIIDETNDTNWEFLRQNECGGQYWMWYKVDDKIYGASDDVNNGIPVTILLNQIVPQDNQELMTFNGVITWEDKFHPSITDDPGLD